jgi:hypothetical protein
MAVFNPSDKRVVDVLKKSSGQSINSLLTRGDLPQLGIGVTMTRKGA